MINLNTKSPFSDDDVDLMVQEGIKHPNWELVRRRARKFNTWYDSEVDEFATRGNSLYFSKEELIERNSSESESEYNTRLKKIVIIPLEQKFLSAQKRIYDENNVDREYPDDNGFWEWNEANFDDQAKSATEFFRDKVLFVKDTLGFGAVVTDLRVDIDGNTIKHKGKPIPYSFVVQPHEIYNFTHHNGRLTLLTIRQLKVNAQGKEEFEWRAYTTEKIYVYKEMKSEDGNTRKNLVRVIKNAFGEVPATLLRGDIDTTSSFAVGRPRRMHLSGLYLALTEIIYDLQVASELYAHPIFVMPESIAKRMSGISDGDTYGSQEIRNGVGMGVIHDDDMPPSGDLIYQANMQGLQHLQSYAFDSLLGLLFNLAMVRDKSVVKSNVSGISKGADEVEERGLLSATANDMEEIELEVWLRHAIGRGGKNATNGFKINYSKHYDMSSADQIWQDYAEGLQYGGMTIKLAIHMLKEYLKKRSAPNVVVEEVILELENKGFGAFNSGTQIQEESNGSEVGDDSDPDGEKDDEGEETGNPDEE